jgi:hypothetical protein
MLSSDDKKLIADVDRAVEEEFNKIERVKSYSDQPRFSNKDARQFGTQLPVFPLAEVQIPAYATDNRTRDEFLRQAWKLEPHLAGVVNAVTLIDANRGWTVTGGRNQVNRMINMLHLANEGSGWRTYVREGSLSYWTTDMGFVTELGRDGNNGPVRGLYHTDSARCRLTGKIREPLEYFPAVGSMQTWEPSDFFRICSMPSDDEKFNQLGFCAVSRAIETAKILYAVMVHDQERLLARMPKGLLLLNGITETQWNDSLKARKLEEDSLERRYYSDIQVLASAYESIDAKLVALSQLPDHFDPKIFIDTAMFTYALCFGYDPSEFWPVQFGSIGRGTESSIQRQQATGKGGLEFSISYQERLQNELPDTVLFEFESRDEQGEILGVELQQAKANIVKTLYETGLTENLPLVSRDEARQMLVMGKIIPEEWTVESEKVKFTDTVRVQKEAARRFGTVNIQRALERFPDDDIVTYSWPSNQIIPLSRFVKRYRVFRSIQLEQKVYFDKDGVKITSKDVEQAVNEAEGLNIEPLLTAPEYTE